MNKQNTHDKLFKQIEQIKENAADLIRGIFPADIIAALDLNTLEPDPTSYVDERLSEHFSDLVYNCFQSSEEQEVKITLLFEHKSSQPKHIHVQLLRYMVNIWDRQEKNRETPSLIIPVVFYHGRKKWEVYPMQSYFTSQNQLFSRFIPDFDYILSDLHDYSDEAIKNKMFDRDINKALITLFKYVFDAQGLRDHLKHIFRLLKDRFAEEESQTVIVAILKYLYYNLEDVEPKDFFKNISEISTDAKEVSMTLAYKLKKEGLQEGLQKGIREGLQEGRQEDARNMLARGFKVDVISSITGLSHDQIEKLKKKL